MQLVEGQTVVHPHHGPATVLAVMDRSLGRVSRRYVQLQIHRSDLRVAVPMDSVDDVGLRRVYTGAQAEDLLAVLGGPTGEHEPQWSRRMKANHEKLRTGDLRVIAGVARDLTRRQQEHPLSAGEKDLLKLACRPVLAELALALSLSDEAVEELLERTVLNHRGVGALVGAAS